MGNKEEDKEELRQSYFAYFLLFFPTLIVASIPSTIDGGIFLPLIIKILLLMYQFVAIKNFVDRYYGN